MAESVEIFGAIGDGIAGIAAVLAFFAAAVAVWFSARTLRIERQREHKSARREEREHRARVTEIAARLPDGSYSALSVSDTLTHRWVGAGGNAEHAADNDVAASINGEESDQ